MRDPVPVGLVHERIQAGTDGQIVSDEERERIHHRHDFVRRTNAFARGFQLAVFGERGEYGFDPICRYAALAGDLPLGALDDGHEPTDRYVIQPQEVGFNRFRDRFAVVPDTRCR
ncbi:MAG: hypothetical protein ABSE69_20740 [Roseiarcus sp.]